MSGKTRGQIEAEISEALIRFEKEHMGRGPEEAKTYILKDMIFVRLKGVLTNAEKELAETPHGVELLKRVRTELLEKSRDYLENIIYDIVGAEVLSLHTDISTKTGERVIIFILARNIEQKLAKNG